MNPPAQRSRSGAIPQRRVTTTSRYSPGITTAPSRAVLKRPISATMLVLSLILLIILAMPAIRKKRDETFVED